MNDLAVIRITGKVGIKKEVEETLKRLRLGRKYTCNILKNPNESQIGMIQKVRDFVAFGEIDEETYKKLEEARGKKGKNYFRLHPPRGGIKSKLHFPKGILGNNGKKINDLILKML